MIKRSVVTGCLVGLVLTLVLIYPVLNYFGGPGLVLGGAAPILRRGLLLLSAVLAVVVLALLGSLAAWRNGASRPLDGLKSGVTSGLVASLVFYILLLAPTAAATASYTLWGYEPRPAALYPPNRLVFEFIREMAVASHARLLLVLLLGAILGGIEGTIVGVVRRQKAGPVPSLLDVIELPRPRRQWYQEGDEVWKAGIWAGLIGGGIIWLSITVAFSSNLKVEWPALEAAIKQSTNLISQTLFNDALLVCLGPLFVLAVIGIGALAVLLLRDPPRRHLSRFQAVLIAGTIASVMIFLGVLPIAYFGIGMARYLAGFVVLQAKPVEHGGDLFIVPEADFMINAEWLQFLQQLVYSPNRVLPFFYLLPLVLLATVLFLFLFWIGPQAVLYGLGLPLVVRRPVDRAARVSSAIRAQPASLLPRIYELYANDARALKVLPHLTFQLKEHEPAEVVAGYHTLSTRPDETERAENVIRRGIAHQEGWRWRVEVSELHRLLEEGLTAKTLVQITAIEPPPRDITSTLPLPLSRGCEGIGRVLGELKKVERVEDLSTKLIFLNSAQAVLLDLHRRLDHESEEVQACATPFPELALLRSLVDFWQGFVLTATKDLQGRADLQATLLSQLTGYAPRVRQCVVVTNQGLNVAQNVRLQIAGGDGYRVAEGAEQVVEILSPQDSRELEFWIVPEGPQRLRLSWELTYDDAVDIGRRVEFADAMELVQDTASHPFQRIFPIPYVTGTPLRTGQMFVGRQDIFSFVREHLLGAYQNNVIVLHGQRRTGKTSILYRLKEVLADSHVAVLVDMQGKAARGTADFLYALSDDIVYSLERNSVFVDLPERSEYEEAPEFTFRSRFLRAVVDELDSRNLILMFDEFEELQKRVEDGRLEPEIFPFLRNLMQHEPRLDFLFSGTHKLEELGAEYWSILFNIAAYKRITFLDEDEVRRLVTEPVADYGMEYDPLAVERIMQVTAGHPYFVQVVCHEMVALHNEEERNYLTMTCVDNVLERIIERGEAHFKYIWAGAEPGEQKVMLALVDLLADADAIANPAQVAGELNRKGYGLSEDDLARALACLRSRDIVSRSGPQSTLYRFKIDLIRRWISITRPAL